MHHESGARERVESTLKQEKHNTINNCPPVSLANLKHLLGRSNHEEKQLMTTLHHWNSPKE
jgi:hypothetical protein